MASLIREIGGVKQTLKLDSEYVVFGRSESCDIQLEFDPEISREHCGIRHYEDGTFTVIDFGSRNGTFVNDERVFAETKLRDSDRLRLGRRTEYRFTNPRNVPDTEAAARPSDAVETAISPPPKLTTEPTPDPELAKTVEELEADLEKKDFHSVFQDIVKRTRRPSRGPRRGPPTGV